MNPKCGLHGQDVDEHNCSTCPVRAVKHSRPCKSGLGVSPHADSEPVTTQELLDVTDAEVLEMVKEAGMNIDDLNLDQPHTFGSGEAPPNYPPLSMQMWTYKEALIKWVKAGRPKRTQEEVEKIHSEHCVPCEWYDAEQKRCKGCGCTVSVGSLAVFNKLKMKTEHCPKDKF